MGNIEATVVRVRCRSRAYYRNRMREKDTVIDFYLEDMDEGVYRAGANKDKPKPGMPKWAQEVPSETPLTVPDNEEGEDVTTLSQMSKRGTPAQQKAAQKVKDDQKRLDSERVTFEAEKAAFEASKDACGDNSKAPTKEETVNEPKKQWRGATKGTNKK